ncbi:MAG: cellulase family glycosylhydrolase [Trueperaceae bacterium]|nr:cellulase family glycosylhydrolase [Trueperaceae bacterium]
MRTDGPQFKDHLGRQLHFRGINLGGSSKLPYGHKSHEKQALDRQTRVSFVGRPFPLEEADEHFARLKTWGFNLIRFVVTWEALEHEGPGIYDYTYIAYVKALLEKAASYGFYLYIDPHQDVWSRFCGGDGAPAWTLELAGFDLSSLAETGAATLHAIHGNPFPHMIWGTNYGKLASATMFTLFWAGRDLAPKTKHKGVSLQDVLQDSYIAAFAQLAQALGHIPQLIGYGVMNEPSAGFIGVEDLKTKAHSLLLRGPSPSVLQAMGLGAGLSQKIEVWELGLTGLRLKHIDEFNKRKKTAWYTSRMPIWQENAVWEKQGGKAKLLRPQHFSYVNDKKIHFYRDYYLPFARRFIREISKHHKATCFFIEGIPADPELYWPETRAATIVHAPHWYDVATLITKRFMAWLSFDTQYRRIIAGKGIIHRVFQRQLQAMQALSRDKMGNVPTLIGEVGIPMDLDNKRAYTSANYKKQIKALDRSLSAMEASLLSYCIWNYSSDNSHEHGDGWNAEDFSIYSPDKPFQKLPEGLEPHLYQGGRALDAFIRPYAPYVAGTVTKMRFDLTKKVFELCFISDVPLDPDIATVIYLPDYHYLRGYTLELSDGAISEAGNQMLHYHHDRAEQKHQIIIRAKD